MTQLLSQQTDWRERAACLEFPAVLFFGLDDTESSAERRSREDRAKTICDGCDVRQQCLEYSLATREPYGIWGGLTEVERRSRLHKRSN